MGALSKRLAIIEPQLMAQAGELEDCIYGIVSKVVDGMQCIERCWKGTIGNMVPTNEIPTIFTVQKLEVLLLKHKKYKCMFGGRAGMKSIFCMQAMIGDVNSCGSRVFVIRERMKALKESIYSGIEHHIGHLNVGGFRSVPSHWEIRHKTKGKFTFGGMQNIIDMKGSVNYKYFLMEESARTKQQTIDTLGPTLRGVEGAELWYIWNPESSTDPMSTEFITPYQEHLDRDGYYEDEYHIIIKIGFEDNPWFMADSSLRTEYLKDKAKMEDGRMSRARYDHIWHGAFNDTVENALISPDWFDACVDAHVKLGFEPKGARVVTHDPSDVGEDAKGYAYRHGVVYLEMEEIQAANANFGIDLATAKAHAVNADVFGWDCDGLGAPLRNQVASAFGGTAVKTFMFKGSESVNRPEMMFDAGDHYGMSGSKKIKDVVANKRAQNYLLLAERCRKTYEATREPPHRVYHNPEDLISFSSSIKCLQKLRAELCQLPLKPNGKGMIMLYTKAEMRAGIMMPDGRKMVIPSPNLGDCVMMSQDDAANHVAVANVRRPPPLRSIGRK